MSVLLAVVLLAAWHAVLGKLSYKIVEGERRRNAWARFLGRIIIPLLLVSFAVHFAGQVVGRLARPAPFVTGNVNDGKEIERELDGGL